MPHAIAHTSLMLPEVLVIESLLEAHGIRFVMAGKDIVAQCPHFAVLFGGISVLVEEEDLENARTLIADIHDVPGYKSIESGGRRFRFGTEERARAERQIDCSATTVPAIIRRMNNYNASGVFSSP